MEKLQQANNILFADRARPAWINAHATAGLQIDTRSVSTSSQRTTRPDTRHSPNPELGSSRTPSGAMLPAEALQTMALPSANATATPSAPVIASARSATSCSASSARIARVSGHLPCAHHRAVAARRARICSCRANASEPVNFATRSFRSAMGFELSERGAVDVPCRSIQSRIVRVALMKALESLVFETVNSTITNFMRRNRFSISFRDHRR